MVKVDFRGWITRADPHVEYRAEKLLRTVITPHPSEEIVAYACVCGYASTAHLEGRCPTESEARAMWGDR